MDNTNSHNPNTPIPSLVPIATNNANTMNIQPDFNTLSYRLDGIEKQIGVLQNQLQHYVPVRENELQLRNIQESVHDVKDDVAEIRKTINDMAQSINAQRESQSQLQIRALYIIVSAGLIVVTGVITFWLTHLIG
jgi:septal ring factor EnvC (AmiA/AmiB activator)